MGERLSQAVIKVSSKVVQGLFIIMLLIISNFPFVFSLAFIPMNRQILLSFVFFSITLFPSVVAITYAIWEPIEEFSELKIIKRFWKSYRQNFKQSFICAAIFTVALYVLTFDYFYVENMSPTYQFLKYVILVVIALILTFMVTLSGVVARYDLKIKLLFANALILYIKHFIKYFIAMIGVVILFLLSKIVIGIPVLQFLCWFGLGYLWGRTSRGILEKEESDLKDEDAVVEGNIEKSSSVENEDE